MVINLMPQSAWAWIFSQVSVTIILTSTTRWEVVIMQVFKWAQARWEEVTARGKVIIKSADNQVALVLIIKLDTLQFCLKITQITYKLSLRARKESIIRSRVRLQISLMERYSLPAKSQTACLKESHMTTEAVKGDATLFHETYIFLLMCLI